MAVQLTALTAMRQDDPAWGKGWVQSHAGGLKVVGFCTMYGDKPTYPSCTNSFCLQMRFVVVTDT